MPLSVLLLPAHSNTETSLEGNTTTSITGTEKGKIDSGVPSISKFVPLKGGIAGESILVINNFHKFLKAANRHMTPASPIRVLISDRKPLSGQLVALALAQGPDLKPENVMPDLVVEAAQETQPEVVILSHTLSDVPGKGINILKEILAVSPHTRVIMLLDDDSPGGVVESLRSGARGVFCRSLPLEMLVRCVKQVHAGQVWLNSAELEFVLTALADSPRISVTDSAGVPLLSRREEEVISGMVKGMTNREIAEALRLSENTVKNYVYRIFEKLGVSNRVEAVMYAAAHNGSLSAKLRKEVSSDNTRGANAAVGA